MKASSRRETFRKVKVCRVIASARRKWRFVCLEVRQTHSTILGLDDEGFERLHFGLLRDAFNLFVQHGDLATFGEDVRQRTPDRAL